MENNARDIFNKLKMLGNQRVQLKDSS